MHACIYFEKCRRLVVSCRIALPFCVSGIQALRNIWRLSAPPPVMQNALIGHNALCTRPHQHSQDCQKYLLQKKIKDMKLRDRYSHKSNYSNIRIWQHNDKDQFQLHFILHLKCLKCFYLSQITKWNLCQCRWCDFGVCSRLSLWTGFWILCFYLKQLWLDDTNTQMSHIS